MRTDVKVDGKLVMALVTPEFELTHSVPTIRKEIKDSGKGVTFVSKDFLLSSDQRSTVVTRGEKSYRRKCDAIFQKSIQDDCWAQLVAGERIITWIV